MCLCCSSSLVWPVHDISCLVGYPSWKVGQETLCYVTSSSGRLDGASMSRHPAEDSKEIALMEAKVKKLCDLLHEVCRYCCSPDSLVTLYYTFDSAGYGWHYTFPGYGWLCPHCQLFQTIVRTKENVEKKHALTYDEIVQEREEVRHLSC